MKNIAQAATSEIALRKGSTEVMEEGQYICSFGEGGIQAFKLIYIYIYIYFFSKLVSASHEEPS